MDRSKFYAPLRRRDVDVFGTSLSQKQVDGIENLLDVWEEFFSDGLLSELAYDLATAYHETAHTMQPITERGRRSYFNKYEPGTRIGERLGNTKRGDGYRFRGEGHVQNTGRANAAKATKRINEVFGLNIDLVADPSQRGDPFISAISLFLGNREGWWTTLPLTKYVSETRKDYVNARRVVNGTDRATLIAGYAEDFEAALKAADYAPNLPPQRPADAPKPPEAGKDTSTPKKPSAGRYGLIGGLIALAIAAWAALTGGNFQLPF